MVRFIANEFNFYLQEEERVISPEITCFFSWWSLQRQMVIIDTVGSHFWKYFNIYNLAYYKLCGSIPKQKSKIGANANWTCPIPAYLN